MAKSIEKTGLLSDEPNRSVQAVMESATKLDPPVKPADRPSDLSTQPRVVQPQVKVDDSTAVTCYANFCRVTGTPEELIIDFGLNTQPMGTPDEPIAATLRAIVNFYTAKRLLAALATSIQRHEAAFGVLETDVQKRVTSALQRATGQML